MLVFYRAFVSFRTRDISIQAWFQKTVLWFYFVIFIRLRWLLFRWLIWYNWSRGSVRWSINGRPIGWRFFFAVGGVIVGIIKSSEFFEYGIISDGKIFCCCVQSLNLYEMLIFFCLNTNIKFSIHIRFISGMTILPSKKATMLLYQRWMGWATVYRPDHRQNHPVLGALAYRFDNVNPSLSFGRLYTVNHVINRLQ